MSQITENQATRSLHTFFHTNDKSLSQATECVSYTIPKQISSSAYFSASLVKVTCFVNPQRQTGILTKLSQECHNLQEILVRINQEAKYKSDPDKDVDEIMEESKTLANLIMKQKKLRKFVFWCHRAPRLLPNLISNGLSGKKLEIFEKWHTQTNCMTIMEALEAHANSLEILSFGELNSLHWQEIANLKKFKKLKELNFVKLSYQWNLTPLKLLYTSSPPNLQKLSFSNSQIYAHKILKIIKVNSQNLTTLDLQIGREYWIPPYNTDKDYHLFFKHVGSICPKLLHFRCFITYTQDLESIFELVKSCTRKFEPKEFEKFRI
ncbi:9212_t:CDS:2 [Ambispora gerdemannii]|uniref:9212_t:CDS:1 n=1 Tax=Ambispora gerdemannii TaxID=144530 RepID=A0A9N9FU57_9GLOM|nr:9212_t:CDS:2 [Ambispora gerdemannii]